jgi:glycine dehydrogenase
MVELPERTKPWLQQDVFEKYHSETNMMRYINELVQKDFSLVNGMIPLGSCTMKLNAAAELMPVSWPEFANMHPFAPRSHTEGYDLSSMNYKEVV